MYLKENFSDFILEKGGVASFPACFQIFSRPLLQGHLTLSHKAEPFNPFPNDKFKTSKLKEFADDNFRFNENGRVFEMVRKHCAKRRNCSLRAISPFPTVFSKGLYSIHVKTRACSGKG